MLQQLNYYRLQVKSSTYPLKFTSTHFLNQSCTLYLELRKTCSANAR